MFGICFIKVQPTTYLLEYRKGRLVREGAGLAFFYYAPTTSLVAVPTASDEVPRRLRRIFKRSPFRDRSPTGWRIRNVWPPS